MHDESGTETAIAVFMLESILAALFIWYVLIPIIVYAVYGIFMLIANLIIKWIYG